MRKALLLAPVAAAALALGTAAPASAHQQGGPCGASSDPGHSGYAAHHVVPAAQAGALGNDGHKPGEHRGYSVCLGVHS